MRKKLFLSLSIWAIILLFLSSILGGCAAAKKQLQEHKQEEKQEEKQEQVQEKHEKVTPPVKTTAVPKSLDNIESNAQDMIDDIAKKDWTKANEKLSALEKEWATYQPLAKVVKASQKQIADFSNDINNLKATLKTKKVYESSLAANKVTMDSLNFMALYKTVVPIEVGKLDFYGRQVLFTSENGDWKQAESNSEATESTWNSIKSKVQAINPNHAKDFSDTVMKLSQAVKKHNATDSKKLSQEILDKVDTLESDFKK